VALAFAVGFPAVFTGIVIHIIGPVKNSHIGSGDYTGFGLLATGGALAMLGIVVLFRSLPSWWYRAGAALAAVPVAALVLLPLGVAIFATHAPRYIITPQDLGRPYEDVSFETSDGLTIRGWYVPSQNGAAVMVIHGSSGARIRPLDHARMLVRHGYGVLLFDVRGHGESDGATNAFGWGAHPDAIAASEYLSSRPDVDDGRVGVMGVSMGAEIALDAATYAPAFRAIVADGAGGRSVNEVSSLGLTPGNAVNWLMMGSITAFTGALSGTWQPSSIEDRAPRIDTPTLLIASQNIAEERDLNRIWVDAMPPTVATLWEVDAGHTGGLKTHPAEYEERVMGFFDAQLLTTP
jgi:pimeloyl-ACP methyl ester carboxylesterase